MKSIEKILKDLDIINFEKILTNKETEWNEIFLKKQREVFKTAYLTVPAYRNFLRSKGFVYQSGKKFKFKDLPIMDKANYLKQYPMNDLVMGGSLKQPYVLTSTSGSTGQPFYFLRSELIDLEYSYIIEKFLEQGRKTKNEPTLVLICFGMGVWIGGVISYQAFELASRRRNLPVSILTPGINKTEIIKALKLIGPNYKNIVLAGYPPFIKDVIDEAVEEGIDFNKFNTRFVFAAEVFSEDFRDYICDKAKVRNLYRDTLSIYGSADIGAMAWETGALILLKRLLLSKNNGLLNFFGVKHKMPTIGYFNPAWLQFESENDEVLITGKNAIPFVRYAIGDYGGTMIFSEIKEKLKLLGINYEKEIKKAGLSDVLFELPCVFVYERKDFSVTLYGLQIYPEIIRQTVSNRKFASFLTGKFSMSTKFDKKQDQYLEIVLETRKGTKVSPEERKDVFKNIVEDLSKKNSEYMELKKHIGKRSLPVLIFAAYEDKDYFAPGVKQKWVLK